MALTLQVPIYLVHILYSPARARVIRVILLDLKIGGINPEPWRLLFLAMGMTRVREPRMPKHNKPFAIERCPE